MIEPAGKPGIDAYASMTGTQSRSSLVPPDLRLGAPGGPCFRRPARSETASGEGHPLQESKGVPIAQRKLHKSREDPVGGYLRDPLACWSE